MMQAFAIPLPTVPREPADALRRRVFTALDDVSMSRPRADLIPAVAAFLVDTVRNSTLADNPSAAPSTRSDRAWSVVWHSHIEGERWTMNLALSAQTAGVGAVTTQRMRRAVRLLKAHQISPTGHWLVDRRVADELTFADLITTTKTTAPAKDG